MVDSYRWSQSSVELEVCPKGEPWTCQRRENGARLKREQKGNRLVNGIRVAEIFQRPGEEKTVQPRGRYSEEARKFRICCPESTASSQVFLSCRSFVLYLKESNFNDEELGSHELFVSQISLVL